MKRYFENGTEVIEASGIGFVIPNSAGHKNSYFDNGKHSFMPIVEANNIELKDSDYIIQVWAASEDLGSDNLTAHGFSIIEDGKRMYYHPRMELLPASIFENKVEGDEVSFDVPIMGMDEDGDFTEKVKAILRFHMTLNQHEYRYRSFGNFEDVVKRVCA